MNMAALIASGEAAVDDLVCQLMGDGEVLAVGISGTEKEPLFDEEDPGIQPIEYFRLA